MSGKKHRHGLFEAAPERFRIHLDHITSASQLSREIIRSAWGWALAGSVLMALDGLATTLIPAWLGRTEDTVVAPAVAGAEDASPGAADPEPAPQASNGMTAGRSSAARSRGRRAERERRVGTGAAGIGASRRLSGWEAGGDAGPARTGAQTSYVPPAQCALAIAALPTV